MAAVLVLASAACSPGDDEPSAETSTTSVTTTVATSIPPAPDGPTAIVAMLETPATLNPIAPGGTRESATVVQRAMLPGAFLYDPVSWEVVPDLVVRVPSAADGDVVVFGTRQAVTWRIAPEAVWSDGVPVSGEDFAFTLRATYGLTECGGNNRFDSLFGIEIVTVTGKSITVEMPGPTTAYETMFPAIVPAHATDGSSVCTDDGVGWPSAGPFIASSIEESRVTVARNDAYWRDPADLDGVEFVAFEDEASIAAAIASGDADVAVVFDAGAAATATDAGARVVSSPSGRLEHLAFDFRRGGDDEEALLAELSFRRGIARALDLDAVASASGWLPVRGVLRGAEPATPWDVYGHDLEEARRLIAIACEEIDRDCVADPPALRLVATGFGVRPLIVGQVVSDLEAAGITVTTDEVAAADMGDRLASGDWDLAVLAFTESPGVAAAADAVFGAVGPDGVTNVYGYGGVGSLAATERAAFQLQLFAGQASVSQDPARVRRLLGETHALLASEVVFVPLVARPRFTVVGERLDGVVANGSPSGVTWNVGAWSLRDA